MLDDQLSRLHDLAVEPALITVLVGANDMLRRSRREAAVRDYARLVTDLPAGSTVLATLPRRNKHALAINALVDDAAAAGRVRVADMRGRALASLRGTRADDRFHPNERGYRHRGRLRQENRARGVDPGIGPSSPAQAVAPRHLR